MVPPTDDVKNWMHMFRWIVKTIRDEHEVDEAILVRSAALETDCGLAIEQVIRALRLRAAERKPPAANDAIRRAAGIEVGQKRREAGLAVEHEEMVEAPQLFEAAGLLVGGTNPQSGLVEIVEVRDHPFMVGVQYHPEFKSKPNHAHQCHSRHGGHTCLRKPCL